jgi:hypothetical protein
MDCAPDGGLYDALRRAGVAVYAVGDCVAPHTVTDAVHDARRVARAL